MREKKKPITVVYHGHETSGVERRNESLEVSGELERKIRERLLKHACHIKSVDIDLIEADVEFFVSLFAEVVAEAKAEIAHAIYSGGSLEMRKVLHKWFGRFDE